MRPSPGHHRPDHVIDIPDNQNPPEREQHGRARPMIEHQRDRPRPPHEPAAQHGQDREHDRDHAPQRRVRESYHPETEARERAVERSRQTRADQRRRRDVAEPPAELLRVARGEWNVRADGIPRFPGPEEQIVEAEAGDRQVQRHPRSRPDEPERGGPDPRHDLGAEVSEPGAHVDPADPELGEPRDGGALHDRRRESERAVTANVCSYGRTSERSLNAPTSSATPATIAKPAISPMIAASVTGGDSRANTDATTLRTPKAMGQPHETPSFFS